MKLPPDLERKILEQAGQGGLVSEIELPAPPSTNHLFVAITIKGKPRRVPSKEYLAWQRAVRQTVLRLKSPTAYPVGVELTLVGKWNRQRDAGNVEKPITDALVACNVLADDNLLHVTDLSIHYRPSAGEPRVRVRLIELTRGLFEEVLR